MFHIKEKEHNNKEKSQFTEEIDNVDKYSFVLAEKELTNFFVCQAILFNVYLQKENVLLRNSQSMMFGSIVLKSVESSEKVGSTEVEKYSCYENSQFNVVNHQS